MQLEDEDIREFSELWEQEFHEKLSMEEARHHASLLMELYGVLACPLPEERTDSSDIDPTSHLP